MTTENYFDHDADIGIIGRGNSVEESFIDAAKAMFALMTDLSSVQQNKKVNIEFEEADIELAFVTWLNALLAKAQAENLIFSDFSLQKKGDSWQGFARGEKWQKHMERGIDVKGATLTMLAVKQTGRQWEARCVVDV